MQIISIPEKEKAEKVAVAPGEHLVGEFVGDQAGVSLIVFGSIHGNEPSGVNAMRRISPKLEKLQADLRGRVYLLAGNTRAINKNVRYIDYDLNRHWTLENVERNRPHSSIRTNKIEDIEQRELLEILERIILTAKDEVYAMDLHSTSAESTPFAMIGDTLRNRSFARKFPATFLLGIEEQLDGTILEYLNNLGAVTLGFEAGQHTSQVAVDSQEALIWLALVNAGILPENKIDTGRYRETLRQAMNNQQRIIEIRYRHAITDADNFKMDPGFENFEPVKKGESLAMDKNGRIKAKETSLLLMPLYQTQGNDGFFLGRQISPFWLWVSRVLRKLKIADLMRFLPGVRQFPDDDETLMVNTRVARLFPLEIFHLLGFRKLRWKSEKLIVTRRKHDTKSPFKRYQREI